MGSGGHRGHKKYENRWMFEHLTVHICSLFISSHCTVERERERELICSV